MADDRSDPEVLERVLRDLAARCDLLLGPYSTQLMRRAGRVAMELGRVVWNHGGAGDDVEAARPGHVVSVPTPASRYAEPFLRLLARDGDRSPLWIAHGEGGFGRQVATGARLRAKALGLPVTYEAPPGGSWNLLCAGSFEEEVELLGRVRVPGRVCAVAAGVREFGAAVRDPCGVYGVGQWFPGVEGEAALGVSERDFLTAYRTPPGYPAVQAAAAAILATHCAAVSGSTGREALWSAAAALETTTLFGAFRIDPSTGAQVGHRVVLTRWGPDGPAAVDDDTGVA
ncbi:hypothetical protein ACFQYP_55170 [Nonomuraea antimicrobica]